MTNEHDLIWKELLYFVSPSVEVVSDAASRKVLIGEDPQQHLRPVKR